MKYIFFILVLLTLKGYAQYPFEKFPVKKYDSVAFKLVGEDFDTTSVDYAHYKNYTIKLVRDKSAQLGGKILLYYKGKLIKTADGHFGMIRSADFPLYIEDVNGDGIPDFVFKTFNSAGTGLAGAHIYNTWFIKKSNNDFQTIQFQSFYDKPERQYKFDGKGNYITIGQSLTFYKRHSYWIFDLYQYKNGKLINVSEEYNYPVAVPYLDKETYTPTNKIPKKQLERLSLKQANFFSLMP
jgi:hypothetical protein